jgi:hypothetical protein
MSILDQPAAAVRIETDFIYGSAVIFGSDVKYEKDVIYESDVIHESDVVVKFCTTFMDDTVNSIV